MAIEAERLLAIFEARFTSLEKALVKAKAQSKDSFGSIEADGTKAENALANIGKRGTPNIDKAMKSINALRGQTGNLAAQFNDIGVQLAGGTSPFLIALQQGSQINQVLGQAGARGAVAALGGAFASLVNPISLATIAIIAGGGYVAQYFLSLINGGQKSAETLQKEADLIQRVANQWGAALPALQAYAKAEKEYADQQERANASQAAFDAVQRKILDNFAAGAAELADFQSKLQAIGEDRAANALGEKFVELKGHVQDGTVTQEDFADMLKAVQQVMADTQVSGGGLIGILQQMQAAAAANITTFRQLANEVANSVARGAGTGPANRSSGFRNPTVELPDTAPVPDRAPNREDVGAEQDRYAARQARSTRQRADDYQRLTDRTVKQTSAMVAETEAQRQLNPLIDDYGYAADKARMEQELLTAAQDAGKTITPQLRQEIADLAGQYATASVEARQLAENQRDQARAAQEAARFQKDLSRSIVDGFIEGKKASDILADSLKKLGARLLDLAFDQAFDSKSGGGGILGFLGNLLNFGGSSSGGGIPWAEDIFRASGGPVTKGRPYIVGDKDGLQHAELFVPDQDGTILPGVPKVPKISPRSGSMGARITYAPVNNFTGTSEELAKFREQQARDQRDFSAKVIHTVRLARQGGNL